MLDKETMIRDLWEHEDYHMTVHQMLSLAKLGFTMILDDLSIDEVKEKWSKVFGEEYQ
jgi:hypothetical protein|tara:strand:+ start:239 stop:412 length:174 start_codon:yes stop_codon:yes gene_type:complete